MRLLTFSVALALTTFGGQAQELAYDDPQGWHWYNEALDDDIEPEAAKPITPSLSPTEQKKILQKETQAALDTAIMYPTPENFKHYMTLQNFWTSKAGEFSQMAKQAMLKYPELDYNLQYSHYNGTVKTQLAGDRSKEKDAIAALTSRYGVFFFYRGNEALDSQLALVIKNFTQEHHIALIPISVDGVLNTSFPNSRRDSGQSKKMGISHFPALFLVDPKDESYQPLAYGFITQDDLARQFLDVATGFKPNF